MFCFYMIFVILYRTLECWQTSYESRADRTKRTIIFLVPISLVIVYRNAHLEVKSKEQSEGSVLSRKKKKKSESMIVVMGVGCKQKE